MKTYILNKLKNMNGKIVFASNNTNVPVFEQLIREISYGLATNTNN